MVINFINSPNKTGVINISLDDEMITVATVTIRTDRKTGKKTNLGYKDFKQMSSTEYYKPLVKFIMKNWKENGTWDEIIKESEGLQIKDNGD